MKTKKIHIIIGDIIAILTVLTLVFIVVHSYIMRYENNYVFFTKLFIADKLLMLIPFCLGSLLYFCFAFLKTRKKVILINNTEVYCALIYILTIISICLVPIINFLYVFNNTYKYFLNELENMYFLIDAQFLIYKIVGPICILILVASVVLLIITHKKDKADIKWFCCVTFLLSLMNIIFCYLYFLVFFIVCALLSIVLTIYKIISRF